MTNLKRNLSEQVGQILRSRIMLLEYEAGEHLKETNLAKEFDVSRGPVREAIIKLEREGLVSTALNGRTVVTKFDITYIRNLYEVRLLLEKFAIESLNSELVDNEKTSFTKYFKKMMANIGDNQDYHEADLNFHFQIVKMTNNIILINSWLSLKELFATLIQVTTKASSKLSEEIMNQHQKIYHAIMSNNFESAYKYLEQHLKGAADYYCQAVFRLQNKEDENDK